jgi:hypothetical protein
MHAESPLHVAECDSRVETVPRESASAADRTHRVSQSLEVWIRVDPRRQHHPVAPAADATYVTVEPIPIDTVVL